jgi:preprotein translocase subunit SecF
MEFFKPGTHIKFMKQRMAAAIFSAFIMIASFTALAFHGLNLGLDFTGGTQVDVNFPSAMNVNQIRENLEKTGFQDPVVQAYSSKAFSIRVAPQKDVSQEQLRQKLLTAMPTASLGGLDYIGPQVGKNLLTNGLLAILVSLIGTMIYIAIRFEWRFAVSAAIALIHDPVLILGIFSFFHLEFNMIVLTGVLTVIGYSLNDTIVVYDRVRENFRKLRKGTPMEVMDQSVNQTLSRTIMTSGLTLLVVIVLYFFGGPTVHGFALALIIGIVIGTYSSIYVASSLAVLFGLNRTHLMIPTKRLEDSTP